MNQDQLQLAFQANYNNLIGNYDRAVELYTQILSQTENYEILIAKIIALQNLNNLDSCLKECENAILHDRKRWEGYFRRGKCNLLEGKIKAAQIDFEDALEKAPNTPLLRSQIEAQKQKCQAVLNNQILPSNKLPAQNVQEQQEPQVIQEVKNAIIPKQSGKIKYSWYQTVNKVGIEINYSLSDISLLKQKFETKSAQISFPTSDNSEYDLNLILWGEIIPENTKVQVTLNKIDIQMEKKLKEQSWSKLDDDASIEIITGNETEKQEQQEDTKKKVDIKNIQQQSVYPSSSKKPKNWDKIDKEIEEDITKNKDDYGEGDPLNSLFKQIYSNADENTRKAMVKSFQTSGGTVLSTNWDEVKQKDYEDKDRPDAPKGQEWRKWEK